MAKANELRIGNLINDMGSNPYTVSATDIVRLQLSESKGKTNLDFNSIPLTEEVLLKFGFEYFDDYFTKDRLYVSFDADKPIWIGKEGCCQKETIVDSVLFIHQLQNIFYCLTGKELTYTP